MERRIRSYFHDSAEPNSSTAHPSPRSLIAIAANLTASSAPVNRMGDEIKIDRIQPAGVNVRMQR